MSESRVERRERERREEERRRRRILELERELELEEGLKDRRKQGKGKRKRKSKVGGIIALVIILLLAFVLIRIWLDARPGAAEPIVVAASGEFEDSNRINILFLGTNQGLSDTIMVFSLDMEKQRLDQISIPRDTYYPRPGYSGAAFQKMNSVFSTEGSMGASQAAGAILGGVPIHYYAEVDTIGSIKIINAMGGVDMYVPIDMQYTDVNQDLYIDLKAGPQHLTGEQALMFLRFRSAYPDADLGRMSAQQDFLKAAFSQLGALNIPSVAVVVQREVDTNMGITAALGLAARAARMNTWDFVTHKLPGGAGMQDGLSYFFHDAAATKELMRQIYSN